MTTKTKPCYGYAVINGTLRLWDYDTRTQTPNYNISWSSQELEHLATNKDAMFDFLLREKEHSTPSNN